MYYWSEVRIITAPWSAHMDFPHPLASILYTVLLHVVSAQLPLCVRTECIDSDQGRVIL